jgi:hypothetical protein
MPRENLEGPSTLNIKVVLGIQGLADVLFGRYNPGGRLPYTVPTGEPHATPAPPPPTPIRKSVELLRESVEPTDSELN